ncbi:hypothetical protein K439DRAFT_1625156 [Ramaria rubella]|nr:hypothetical protein K439DRAFT_1625156 [Ramaria rubella]
MPKANSSKESKKKLAPSPISCGIHATERAGLQSSKAKTTTSVKGPMTRTPPVTPQKKRNTKGPPSDAEVISVHTELVPLQGRLVTAKSDSKLPKPSPQKKHRKHLNGVIPMSEEEVSEPGDASKSQGGWSDGSSLSGFIVNDDDPVEVRTDSGDSFLGDLRIKPTTAMILGEKCKSPENSSGLHGVLQTTSTVATVSQNSQLSGLSADAEVVGCVENTRLGSPINLPNQPAKPCTIFAKEAELTVEQHERLLPITPATKNPCNKDRKILQNEKESLQEASVVSEGLTRIETSHSPQESMAGPRKMYEYVFNVPVLFSNSYNHCLIEYQKTVPEECAVMESLSDVPAEHLALLKNTPHWKSVVEWSMEHQTRLWSFKDFSESGFAIFCLNPSTAKTCLTSQGSPKARIYGEQWLTLPRLEGEEEVCLFEVNNVQRLITMLGSIYMQPSLEFNSYKGAIVIGTKGVSVDSKQATSSRGKYSSSSWSPSKLPIYDGTRLDEIRWDDVESLPCVSEDLDLDAIVLVNHTTSMYEENNVSLNVQFVVKLA